MKKRGEAVQNSEKTTRIRKLIADMTLFDDILMSQVFDENIKAVTLLLNVILKRKDMEVITAKTQQEYKSPFQSGRSIRLDIYAKDRDGKVYDIEVQQASEGADPHRARFHSGRIDSKMLMESQKFTDLRDSYVIFFTRKDVMKGNLPLYHFDRVCRENGKLFGDGSHIIYVNGSYKDVSDPVGKRIHDFWCEEPEEMYYQQLSESVRHFKKEKGGQEIMSTLLEQFVQEERREGRAQGRAEGKRESARRMIQKGKLSLFDIAEYLDITLEEVEEIKNSIKEEEKQKA